MPTRTRTRRSRAGISGYKIFELLTGKVAYSLVTYSGYSRDGTRDGPLEDLNEFDADAVRHDWELYGKELTAFWRSGEYTCTETLAPFGIDVKVSPHLWAHGGPKAVPWAETFCKAAAKPARKTTKRVTKRKTTKRATKRKA